MPFFQIHLKFKMIEENSHDFSLFVLEMSERHQIQINHQISWVDMFHIAPGSFQYHLLKPEITKSIPTKRNKCNKENSLRVFDCYNDYYMIELGRFQNSSVPVLNFKQHSVPVLTGSITNVNIGTGSKGFGSSVLTVLIFCLKGAKLFTKIGVTLNATN